MLDDDYPEHPLPDLEIEGWPPMLEDALRAYLRLRMIGGRRPGDRDVLDQIEIIRLVLPSMIRISDRPSGRPSLTSTGGLYEIDDWCREFVGPHCIVTSDYGRSRHDGAPFNIEFETILYPETGTRFDWNPDGLWLRLRSTYFFRQHALGFHFKTRWWL